MIYSGSIVTVQPQNLEKAKEVISKFEQFEIHAVSDDKTQIVVSIEALSDKHIEQLCAELKAFEEITEVGHHIFHFEEEVERILENGEKPDLNGFFKSKKREERENKD